MEPSPLTQVSRPDTFQPKIVKLYEALFQLPNADEDHDYEQSEGFWQEFFLLKPDPPSLRLVLQGLNADQMLHLQVNQGSRSNLSCASHPCSPQYCWKGSCAAALLTRN